MRLIAAAEERARRIRRSPTFIIEQQVKQAEEDLRREVAAAGGRRWPRRSCARSSARSDQQRLIDTFVGDVAGNGAHAGAPPPGASRRRRSGARPGARSRMAVMGGSVARRYARALFGIGVDAGKFEALGDELDELSRRCGTSRTSCARRWRTRCSSRSEKRAVLESILPQRRADARGAALRAAAARPPPHRPAARDRARLPRSDRRAARPRARRR